MVDVWEFKLVDFTFLWLQVYMCRIHPSAASCFISFKMFVLKMLFRYTEREGNRASSSHLSHNMPGHHSKSHTNTFRPLACTLSREKHTRTSCCEVVGALILALFVQTQSSSWSPSLCHMFFSSMGSAIHLTSQWLSHLQSVVPYVQFKPERDFDVIS